MSGTSSQNADNDDCGSITLRASWPEETGELFTFQLLALLFASSGDRSHCIQVEPVKFIGSPVNSSLVGLRR